MNFSSASLVAVSPDCVFESAPSSAAMEHWLWLSHTWTSCWGMTPDIVPQATKTEKVNRVTQVINRSVELAYNISADADRFQAFIAEALQCVIKTGHQLNRESFINWLARELLPRPENLATKDENILPAETEKEQRFRIRSTIRNKYEYIRILPQELTNCPQMMAVRIAR
ncbi:hypothetical protein LQW54_011071, partial [Pestalotiopsis sp. IQ-011]